MSESWQIRNRSRQLISIQVRPPNGDFFYEEQQIRLSPGKSTVLPKKFVNQVQIENLKASGQIAVVEAK